MWGNFVMSAEDTNQKSADVEEEMEPLLKYKFIPVSALSDGIVQARCFFC
jgi:hypothetical protein